MPASRPGLSATEAEGLVFSRASAPVAAAEQPPAGQPNRKFAWKGSRPMLLATVLTWDSSARDISSCCSLWRTSKVPMRPSTI
eukprot:scaffold181434_cov36-Prasinocladus_malaysianus.AAC.2